MTFRRVFEMILEKDLFAVAWGSGRVGKETKSFGERVSDFWLGDQFAS